jgi:ABC-type nitrate/sulfonate/bicarbonate transport system permease component
MVLTGFALALDAVVSVIEKRLLVWRPSAGETERSI